MTTANASPKNSPSQAKPVRTNSRGARPNGEGRMDGKMAGSVATADAVARAFENGTYPYAERLRRAEYETAKAKLQAELLKVQHWAQETGQKWSPRPGRIQILKNICLKNLPMRSPPSDTGVVRGSTCEWWKTQRTSTTSSSVPFVPAIPGRFSAFLRSGTNLHLTAPGWSVIPVRFWMNSEPNWRKMWKFGSGTRHLKCVILSFRKPLLISRTNRWMNWNRW